MRSWMGLMTMMLSSMIAVEAYGVGKLQARNQDSMPPALQSLIEPVEEASNNPNGAQAQADLYYSRCVKDKVRLSGHRATGGKSRAVHTGIERRLIWTVRISHAVGADV